MNNLLVALGYVAAIGVVAWSFWAGFRVGRRHERESQREEAERMLRIDPPPRSPGQPTNLNAPPSVVRQARVRNSRWTDEGDMQR